VTVFFKYFTHSSHVIFQFINEAEGHWLHRNLANHLLAYVYLFVFLALQPTVVVFSHPGSGLWRPRFQGFLITHNDAPQSVGLLWSSDQSVAETYT
jgi:hypothetical protein